jgi:ribosome biogenesis GTPase
VSKRKLTRRQAWRAEKIQAERLARSQKKLGKIQQTLSAGELGAEQQGRVITRYGASVDVEDSHGTLHRCLLRQNLPPLVCGDRVVWQAGPDRSGVVVALMPRQTLLVRPSADKQPKPVAANISQILIVAAPLPALDLDLINRYLVAAELTGIPPLLLINKVDLLSEQALAKLRRRLAVYEHIGYPLLYASTKRAQGLDALRQRLQGHTSIFVGQSGVGKSSLIQALLPHQELRIGALSEASGLGRHTTTATVLYHFPDGGELIDSPGVRDFGLGHVSAAQVAEGFVEFRPYLGQCRFSDCSHTVEPDCALQAAVAAGHIDADRFDSFLRITAALSAEA